ncbi:hypothetical protein VNI00_013558 [Paramarasmius palmivorus]|uniref:Fanconi-associated nuclease n=1 Tax=Paramarasmius palmivorus TaxID=297713 RepID=A0AAW0BY14_9AGAR
MDRTTLGLVFGLKDHVSVEKAIEELDVSEEELGDDIIKEEGCEESEPKESRRAREPRKSAYLRVFEDVVNEISEHERELLSDKEARVLASFTKLSYPAMVILTRLLHRNTSNWHLESSMEKYKKDIGEDGLHEGITELCSKSVEDLLKLDVKVEVDETSGTDGPEVIDLTLDSDDEDVKPNLNAAAGPSHLPQAEPSNHNPNPYRFCFDQKCMSLEDVLHRLPVPSLKELVKELKCKPSNHKKDTLVATLLQHARGQTILETSVPEPKGKQKGKARDDGKKQTTLSHFVVTNNQETVLRKKALNKLGRCIKVNPEFYELVCRLNIIFYRSTEQPEKPFLPSLLTIFKKRAYPPYTHNRSIIWSTREEYLAYEEALLRQKQMSDAEVIPDRASVARSTAEPTPGSRSATPVTAARAVAATTPRKVKDEVMDVDMVETVQAVPTLDAPSATHSETLAAKRSKAILRVFESEQIEELWDACLKAEKAKPEEERCPELERFSPGYIYTRLMYKAADAMGPLKRYKEENALLQKLLSQKFWRRGKRADWYQRRALIQQSYLCKQDGSKKKDPAVLREAWEGIVEALEDDDTHLVARPELVRRVQALEQKLKVPDQHRCKVERELQKPTEVVIIGVRSWITEDPLQLNKELKPVAGSGKGKEKENRDETNLELTNYFSKVNPTSDKDKNDVTDDSAGPSRWRYQKWTGKSRWVGESKTPVSVEEYALQHYAKLGFNGLHSETSILTTIFALLFWDIIFSNIPGAFETKFQAGPLDLAEDSFYYARKEAIDIRLQEIENGYARSILEKHDRMYRDQQTWCVGVNWEKCKRQDLLEIIECASTEMLKCVCRLFCEDYAARASGVPDLICWDIENRKCKFVEVKGPGDRPSATQKLWFDTLLGTDTEVELLKVKERKFREVNKEHEKKIRAEERAKKKATKSTSKGKRKKPVSEEDEEVHEEPMAVDEREDDEYQPPNSDGSEVPLAKRRLRSTTVEEDDRWQEEAILDNGDETGQPVLSNSHRQPRAGSPSWPTKDNVEVVIVSPPRKKRKVDHEMS